MYGLLFSQDLFFTTRICDTATALGQQIQVVSSTEAASKHVAKPDCRLVIIDLDNGSSLLASVEEFQQRNTALTVIAFGSHVEAALLRQARQAGCDLVLPRSKFTTDLADLLTQYLVEPAGETSDSQLQ